MNDIDQNTREGLWALFAAFLLFILLASDNDPNRKYWRDPPGVWIEDGM